MRYSGKYTGWTWAVGGWSGHGGDWADDKDFRYPFSQDKWGWHDKWDWAENWEDRLLAWWANLDHGDWGWPKWHHWWCKDLNTPPDAVDDLLTVLEPNDVITGSLLDNDTDDDGDTLTVTHINGVEIQVGVPLVLPEGQITVEADGSYIVQAVEDFSFTYTISDGADSDTATVEVNVVDPVYFIVRKEDGTEFWKTNGTEAGTMQVFDPGDEILNIAKPARFQDGFLIEAGTAETGPEPWFTDGTSGGTFPLADLWPGDTGSSPSHYTIIGNKAVYSATGLGIGTELFVTDGTPEGTGLLADIQEPPSVSNPSSLLSAGGFVYLSASTIAEGRELWRTDATSEGTVRLADLNPGPEGSDPRPLFELDGRVVVDANLDDGVRELWISDGSSLGTILLAEETTGAGPGPNGDAFFFRRDGQGTFDLWRSDGTIDGTEMVADINTNGTGGDFTQLGNTFMFAANYRESGGFELWKTDGTADGTEFVVNINSNGGGPGFQLNPPSFAPLAGGLIFKVDDGIHGLEPWFTDGTAEGTYLIEDINPNGSSMSSGDGFTYLEGRVVFVARTPDEGRELWISDGTPEGTQLLADIVPGADSSFPQEFIV